MYDISGDDSKTPYEGLTKADIAIDDTIEKALIRDTFRSLNVEIFKPEIGQFKLLVAFLDIKESIAPNIAIAHSDMRRERAWDIRSATEIEKLTPRSDEKEINNRSGNILDKNMLVVLRSVGTHFEPEKIVGLVGNKNTTENDIAHRNTFAANSQTAMTKTIFAVLDEDIGIGTIALSRQRDRNVKIIGLKSISIRTFTTLESDSIIIDSHIAMGDEDIVNNIEIDSIS